MEVVEPTDEGDEILLIPSFPMIDKFYGGKWDGMMPVLDFALGSGVYVARKHNSEKSEILANVPDNIDPTGYVTICLGLDKLVEYLLKNDFIYGQAIKP